MLNVGSRLRPTDIKGATVQLLNSVSLAAIVSFVPYLTVATSFVPTSIIFYNEK